MIVAYLLLLLLGLFVLFKAADLTIKIIDALGVKIKIPRFVLSSFFLSLATASPELFVGILSAANKKPILSLGNVLGSSIADLTLIAGLAILIGGSVFIGKKMLFHEILLIGGLVLLPFVLLLDRSLSTQDGLILLGTYLAYNLFLFLRGRKEVKMAPAVKKKVSRLLAEFLFCLLILAGSAQLVVWVSEKISQAINIPMVLIGFFLVTLGTTLPELIVECEAAKKREAGIFFGDIFGNVVAYLTGILGMVALISPIEVKEEPSLLVGAIFLLVIFLVMSFLLSSERRLTRRDGAFLVVIYLVFALTQIFFLSP